MVFLKDRPVRFYILAPELFIKSNEASWSFPVLEITSQFLPHLDCLKGQIQVQKSTQTFATNQKPNGINSRE